MSVEELALQRSRYADMSDADFRFMLQQVDGRHRTRDKLPSFAVLDDWWYPVRLSCEQCSSEWTARYKAHIVRQLGGHDKLIDLTGGYGVDSYFMSEGMAEAHYVERDEELCRIVQHNFALYRPHVEVHNTTAEDFLDSSVSLDGALVYVDPARRDSHGGKVFRIEDCVPNVVELLDNLRHAKTLMIKLSPMLDITAAMRSLGVGMSVHVVGVKNEVKEVLLVMGDRSDTIHATNLVSGEDGGYEVEDFVFRQEEERGAVCALYESAHADLITSGRYIYEPNSAIMKAGAYKLVGARYGLCKMAQHTHLYVSERLIKDFPGRVWEIVESNVRECKDLRANVMTRNYPMTADTLRKKLKVKEGEENTIIGARLADKPTLFLCRKV